MSSPNFIFFKNIFRGFFRRFPEPLRVCAYYYSALLLSTVHGSQPGRFFCAFLQKNFVVTPRKNMKL
jgi:hypothetical protein